MREEEYRQWLIKKEYKDTVISARISNARNIERYYGDLDKKIIDKSYQEMIRELEYSTQDERENRTNTSRIQFNGNIRENLAMYKQAARLYLKFVQESSENKDDSEVSDDLNIIENISSTEGKQQRLSLERDMQKALRLNINSLEPSLKVIDDGIERSVKSGFIDITCEDDNSLVVIELKAGKAPNSAVTQILGYIGDLMEEDDTKPVRGILVAHDFDQKTRSAARAVPNLKLKKYSVEFKFMDDEC